MPIYEYHCQNCGAEFEKMVPLSRADSQPECPECHQADTRKRISAIAARTSGLSTTGVSAAGCGTAGSFT